MMSEEEKRVIKLLKGIEDIRSCTTADDLDEEDAKIILNLIEKQQKELDKKDKIIKEKIEEYEEILQSSIIKEDYKKEVEHTIRVLKELRGEN